MIRIETLRNGASFVIYLTKISCKQFAQERLVSSTENTQEGAHL